MSLPSQLHRRFRRVRILLPAAIAWLALAHGVTPALALRGVTNYPKVAQYVGGISSLTPAQRDTLSWYDLLVTTARPSIVDELRSRNPNVEIFFTWMPQNLAKSTGTDTTWWYPDTTWNLIRLSQFYAGKNNWFLRDTAGNKIPEWSGFAANWTRYCPRGVYGTSVGLTYVEWLVQVAIPRIVTSGQTWPKWGPGSGGYDGLMLEILVDCVGSFGWQPYANADPDLDGQPEGVTSTCTQGGWGDSLSVLYREMNEMFGEEIARIQDEGALVLINAENSYMGPSWRADVSGVKLERWQSYLWNPWVDWWETFYGVLDYNGDEMIGPGYRWAEDFVSHHGNDPVEGWDHSLVEVIPDPNWPAAKCARLKRWGLGTTLLGEGYFIYTKNERDLFWQPEFDWDFGLPTGGFAKQTYANGANVDTLYWREFTKGFVEVNPHNRIVNNVPAEDARFGFWQTVSDLLAVPLSTDAARVTFTMPTGLSSPVQGVELRYASHPVTAESWDEALPCGANPIQAPPGSVVDLTLAGLEAGTTYYFAARNRVYARLEPGTSNLASVDLPTGPQDLTPPTKILDLAPADAGTSWVRLTWSAPVDPEDGNAARYRIRYRAGAAIQTEGEWNAAVQAPGVYPWPAAPGAPETYTVAGLSSATLFGFAVRAEDSAGNLAPLSNPLTVTTEAAPPPPPPPPPDTIPPAAIADLSAEGAGLTWIDLRWTAPGDDGSIGIAASYAVRLLADRAIQTEADWNQATPPVGPLPIPSGAGTAEAFRVAGLASDRLYGLAVRATDDSGNLAALSAPLSARTLAPDDPPDPPVNLPPTAIDDLAIPAFDSTSVTLRWTAPHDGEGGRVSHYRLAILQGDSLRSPEDLGRCVIRILPQTPAAPGTIEQTRVEALAPSTLYAFTVFGVDGARVIGPIGAFAHTRTLDSPAPPPPADTSGPEAIEDLAAEELTPTSLRLAWTAPADAEGEVAAYAVRRLPDRAISSESDWFLSVPVAEAPPLPAAPGTRERLPVGGLVPERAYGFAVRAVDLAGNLSALGPSLLVVTPPRPDTLAPPKIIDLRGEALTPVSLRLEWSAVTDDRDGPVSYRIGRRVGGPIRSEADWTSAETTQVVPTKGTEASTLLTTLIHGLRPATSYGLAVRAVDAAGNRSSLAEDGLQLATPEWPDTLPPTRIVDLAARDRTLTSILLRWSAPRDSVTGASVVSYAVGRLRGSPLENEADWNRAEVLHDLPPPSAPGSIDTLRVTGLTAGTGYGLAVRSRDAAGLLSPLSAPLFAETLPDTLSEPPPDTTETPDPPPAAVLDLSIRERAVDSVILGWTATGEDSLLGTASALEIRFLAAAEIEDEADWAAATRLSNPPPPAPAGSRQEFRWEGITAVLDGWVAVRARDAAGQWSPVGSSARVSSYVAPPPPPPELEPPPAPVLRGLRVTTSEADLALRHVASAGAQDSTVRYEGRLDEAEITPERWEAAAPLDGLPLPGPAGTEAGWTLLGLSPDRTYFVSIRAVGNGGLVSSLGSLSFRTEPEDLAPPEPPGRPALHWSEDRNELTLTWVPSPDARVVGYHVYGQAPAGTWLRLHESSITAAELLLPRPEPGTLRRLAVRSHLPNGTESPLSDAVDLWETDWWIEGPFPHPITDACRIRVHLPLDFPASASLRVEIRSLAGDREAVLIDGPVAPGLIWDGTWDRRTLRGSPAPPGFHRLLCEGGGRRTVRTIYLAP